jgi:predicted CopG family antitoxin
MASKTISLSVEAYEKLRRARKYSGESFSQVVLRATWPEESITGGELLERVRKTPPVLSNEILDAVDAAIGDDSAPRHKWNDR